MQPEVSKAVVRFLWKQGGASASFIAVQIGADIHTVHGILARKRKQGWVRKFAFDRTIIIWELTSLGKAEARGYLGE